MSRTSDRQIRSSLADRVLRTVRTHALVPHGGRVLIALSGGPDSVALVHVLRELEPDGILSVAGVAHLNHQLRGAEADEDERFCVAMAAELGLAAEVDRADVRALAQEQGRSIEDAARTARYAFLERTADRLKVDRIAVGHSRDDQAETFLLRLLRGAGSRGLAAIRPRAGRVVRPFLEVGRAELRAYVATRGIPSRTDASNMDLTVPRNRVRHELIPYLEREFSPTIVDVLAREAALAREDEDRLHNEAIDLAASVVLKESDGSKVEAEVLASLHPALASRVARIALSQLAGSRFVGFAHVERFLEFVRGGAPGSALSLPGQQAVHQGDRVVLRPEPQRGGRAGANSFRFPLSIPGEVTLDQAGWTISAHALAGQNEAGGWRARGHTVAVAAPALALPLAVRTRRPGDRFKPLGMGGSEKKLQDFLVDRKVARETRDALPLVVDNADRIVWVVGESVSEDFRVTEPSRGVILLKARRLGGEG